MMGERYTLVLHHEFIDIKTGDRHSIEPPLAVSFSIYDALDHGSVVYCVNQMLDQLEHEFLNRFSGKLGDADA